MKKIAFLLSFVIFFSCFAISFSAYNNPIDFYNGNHTKMPMGDPFVMKYNGVYYCYTSGGNCYRSTNMVDWTYVGAVFVGEHTEYLYAPEVFHWNGAFYSISCPNGTTNYIFKSDKPEGPFTAISGELGGGIDGSLFRDDDGSIWFTTAAYNGIELYSMETPESTPQSVSKLPQSMSGMWTEGPSIFKRDGIYYMTFTGNHVLDQAYRVEYAVSDSVTSGWTEPKQNILLLSTSGETTALGHNSIVIGPDLDSYYIVYHNRYPDGTNVIDRGFNMQRILWNGDKPVVALNTGSAENPDLPDYEYRPSGGVEALGERVLSDKSAESIFTAEFNIVPDGTDILFSYVDERNYARISFTDNTILLDTIKDGQSVKTSKTLAKNTYLNKLQCVRVQQTERNLSVYLEGGLLIETDTVGGGRIGYDTENGTVGYMAFSNKALGNLDSEAEKYSCAVYDAVLANNADEFETVSAEESGDALLVKAGDKVRFDMLAQSKMTSTLTLRGRASENTVLNIYVNGVIAVENAEFASSGNYRTQAIRSLEIKSGELKLEVEVVSGEFEFYEISTAVENKVLEKSYSMSGKYVLGMSEQEGSTEFKYGKLYLTAEESPKGDCFGKNIMGGVGYGDYSVEVDIRMESTDNGAEAGIFLRSPNSSDGEASAFRFRRKWYKQCYYVCLTDGAVRLYKQNYGETLLAEFKTDADFTKERKLRLEADGAELTVYLDGDKILSYVDNDHPFMNGKFGIETVNCTASFDNLSIKSLTVKTEESDNTADGTDDAETAEVQASSEEPAPSANVLPFVIASGAAVAVSGAVAAAAVIKTKKKKTK
ncbi:MAG: family 43 glycosylhydrolase [Clostridia bacterium]|nr:family 43 glycosylhydrolase [Clostridia bacterium]